MTQSSSAARCRIGNNFSAVQAAIPAVCNSTLFMYVPQECRAPGLRLMRTTCSELEGIAGKVCPGELDAVLKEMYDSGDRYRNWSVLSRHMCIIGYVEMRKADARSLVLEALSVNAERVDTYSRSPIKAAVEAARMLDEIVPEYTKRIQRASHVDIANATNCMYVENVRAGLAQFAAEGGTYVRFVISSEGRCRLVCDAYDTRSYKNYVEDSVKLIPERLDSVQYAGTYLAGSFETQEVQVVLGLPTAKQWMEDAEMHGLSIAN